MCLMYLYIKICILCTYIEYSYITIVLELSDLITYCEKHAKEIWLSSSRFLACIDILMKNNRAMNFPLIAAPRRVLRDKTNQPTRNTTTITPITCNLDLCFPDQEYCSCVNILLFQKNLTITMGFCNNYTIITSIQFL